MGRYLFVNKKCHLLIKCNLHVCSVIVSCAYNVAIIIFFTKANNVCAQNNNIVFTVQTQCIIDFIYMKDTVRMTLTSSIIISPPD